MSLRDQLLKAGVASKKDVARVERQKKHERRKKQGNRKRKTQAERDALAAQEAARQAALQAKQARRAQREAARAEQERVLRVRNLILGNAVRTRGPQPFWVKRPNGRIVRLQVAPRVAMTLRSGELAVAGLDGEPVIVAKRAADVLSDIEPGAVWFYVREPSGPAGPDEQFLMPEWDISLAPHRVKAAAEARS